MLLLQHLETGRPAATEVSAGSAADGIAAFNGIPTTGPTAAAAATVRPDRGGRYTATVLSLTLVVGRKPKKAK